MTHFILAAVAALIATPALAGSVPPNYEKVRIEVNYRFGDVATAEGRAALDARVKRAIENACPRGDVRDINALRLMQRCRAEATTDAAQQLAALDDRIAGRLVQTAAR